MECISLEEVEGAIKIHDIKKFPNLKDEGYSFFNDTIEELGCWTCFAKKSNDSKSQFMLGVSKLNKGKSKNKKKQIKATKKKQRKK